MKEKRKQRRRKRSREQTKKRRRKKERVKKMKVIKNCQGIDKRSFHYSSVACSPGEQKQFGDNMVLL